jgi:hypothetical protein
MLYKHDADDKVLMMAVNRVTGLAEFGTFGTIVYLGVFKIT